MVHEIDQFILKYLKPSVMNSIEDRRIQKYTNYIYIKRIAYQLCQNFPAPVFHTIMRFFISMDIEQLFVYLYVISKINGTSLRLRLPQHAESPITWRGIRGVSVPNMSISDINYNPYSFQFYTSNHLSKRIIKLPMLTDIQIKKCLSGSIPKEIFQLKHLKKLNLSNNMLSGTIPTELGLCSTLNTLDLSHNFLEGEIPHQIENCVHLRYLYLNDNILTKRKFSKNFRNQLFLYEIQNQRM